MDKTDNKSVYGKKGISGGVRALGKSIKKYRWSYFMIAPFMLIFITFTVWPVIQAIIYSFTSFNVLEAPKWIGLTNYKDLFFSDPLFSISLRNTLFFAVIVGPVGYLLSLTLAWFLNELGSALRSFLTLLFYAPALCSVYAIWTLIFSGDSNGIINAYLIKWGFITEPIQFLYDESYIVPCVIIVLLWSSMGNGFLSFVAGFKNIDKTLCEAGAIDGVRNRWQELWYITLPAMRPQLMFGAVMSVSSSFAIGPQITALCGFPSTNYVANTLLLHLEDYGGTRFQMGYACTIATVLFLMMIVVNTVVQKLIKKVGN